MLIHLIRHAHAGTRHDFDGDDALRPLTVRGWQQSRDLADQLAEAGVDRLWSSPFTRCVQTLEPLGERLGIEVEDVDDLAEGAKGAKALDALLAAAEAGHVVAASSHGDVIPDIVGEAIERGAKLKGPDSLKKGARYELTVADGRVKRIRHIDAP